MDSISTFWSMSCIQMMPQFADTDACHTTRVTAQWSTTLSSQVDLHLESNKAEEEEDCHPASRKH